MCDEKTTIQNMADILKQFQEKQREQKYYLTIIAGENIGKIYPLEKDKVLIGRSQHADITISEGSISRKHAVIEKREGGVLYIRDLNSTNGTFVNGIRVTESPLEDGDKIQLGVSVVFKLSHQDSLEVEFQQSLYESSVKDPLTGVYNKRYFIERLNREFAHALRHFQHLALLMIDIDFFKKVNDTYGHLAGDEILKGVAARIQETLRAGDVLCRYGGEEFAIIVRECKPEHLFVVGERVRKVIEQAPFNFKGIPITITVSVGGASIDEESVASPEDLIMIADQNLYKAKERGRNCTVVSGYLF